MSYLYNTAAAVRQMGIQKSVDLAKEFKREWIVECYIPKVLEAYQADKKGYNFRISCLQSLAAVMEFLGPADLEQIVVPLMVKAMKDPIPNVKFTVSKILLSKRQQIDD